MATKTKAQAEPKTKTKVKPKPKTEPVVPRIDIPTGSASAILSRVIRPEEGDLTLAAAEGFLELGFDDPDLARIQELLAKNQEGQCTKAELEELDNFIRVSDLLTLIHLKARKALQTRPKRRKAR
jgi:hypothetical protein